MTGIPHRRLQEFAGEVRWGPGASSRATKEANLAGCLSECAIQGCDEIESKNRRFNSDIVILAWQTIGPRELFHRHRPQ
jgi:hypothetical protein